jgi:uncharacterized phage-associated protein
MTDANEPIRFRFHERKATAAAALLLELAGGTMEYLRLIKLLYFADREALDAFGHPITGDRYVSMKHGPVLSATYNLVKRVIFRRVPPVTSNETLWEEHIEGVGRYSVRLKKHPGVGVLSEAEIGVLMQVFQRYRVRDMWSLRDEAHALPEWEDPGESAVEIPVEEILQVLGKSEIEINVIRQRALEEAHFDHIFGR